MQQFHITVMMTSLRIMSLGTSCVCGSCWEWRWERRFRRLSNRAWCARRAREGSERAPASSAATSHYRRSTTGWPAAPPVDEHTARPTRNRPHPHSQLTREEQDGIKKIIFVMIILNIEFVGGISKIVKSKLDELLDKKRFNR